MVLCNMMNHLLVIYSSFQRFNIVAIFKTLHSATKSPESVQKVKKHFYLLKKRKISLHF